MPDRLFSEEEVTQRIEAARIAQQSHDTKGQQQAHLNADMLAKAVVAGLAPLMATKPSRDLPIWMKLLGGTLALIISGSAVLGLVWGVAIGPVQTRLDALEKADVATLALTTGVTARLNGAENKIAQLEVTMSTGSRIRDQQQQGIIDQVRGLSQADQQATERLTVLSNSIASILPRLEEILRRQERLENRLGTQRSQPNSDDSPARFWLMPDLII
jgi:hypothetical protein